MKVPELIEELLGCDYDKDVMMFYEGCIRGNVSVVSSINNEDNGDVVVLYDDTESAFFAADHPKCFKCKVLEELRENNAKRREVCATLEERNRFLEERVKELEGKLSRSVRKLSYLNGKKVSYCGGNAFGRDEEGALCWCEDNG